MAVIDNVTKQLNQFQSSLQSVPTKSMNSNQPQSAPLMPGNSSYGINRLIIQQLQMQKTQLEGISDELMHVKENLQISVPRRHVQ